jgi:hypothetical protein
MHRIDNAFAAATLPTPLPIGPVVPGFFQSGNPATGQKATTVDRDWTNAVQEEICAVIERSGLTLSKTDRTQLWQALRTSARYKLTAPLDLYVSPTGNDANTGTAPGSAFKTPQHAWDFIQGNIDQAGLYGITIHVADGTYAPLVCAYPVNGPAPQFVGNVSTPGNVIFTNTNGPAILVTHAANATFSGMRVTSTGVGQNAYGLQATGNSRLSLANIDFGACVAAQMWSERSTISLIGAASPFSISAGSAVCLGASLHGRIDLSTGVCTLTGTPAYSSAFAFATMCGVIKVDGLTFTGGATGVRHNLSTNSVAYANLASNPGFVFPGNAAGVVATGGQFA